MPEPLSLITSAISFAYLRILMILDFISGILRSTRRLWSLLKKPLLCDKDVIQTDDIITYSFLVQESLREYSNIDHSKLWEPTDINKISKNESLLLMASTVAIESPVNNNVEKVYCKILHKGKDNKSGVGSSTKSYVTCHNCGKMGHLKRN